MYATKSNTLFNQKSPVPVIVVSKRGRTDGHVRNMATYRLNQPRDPLRNKKNPAKKYFYW